MDINCVLVTRHEYKPRDAQIPLPRSPCSQYLWALSVCNLFHHPQRPEFSAGYYIFQKFYALLHTPTFFSVSSISPEPKKHTFCINSVATILSLSSNQRIKQKYSFQWNASCQYLNFHTPAERFLQSV